ncbi:hypothetical protein MUK42_33408 [Musa troglodytarum]|uniref:Uncharacterized protein n=1 Tax=Musa troglodytarum TaxID=320322 RepID=A0A9E7FTF3_9LILI|nr:hypothetical protein MUK42_33408 [Musa troglodytarum]
MFTNSPESYRLRLRLPIDDDSLLPRPLEFAEASYAGFAFDSVSFGVCSFSTPLEPFVRGPENFSHVVSELFGVLVGICIELPL